jgi:hypothetical protein
MDGKSKCKSPWQKWKKLKYNYSKYQIRNIILFVPNISWYPKYLIGYIILFVLNIGTNLFYFLLDVS